MIVTQSKRKRFNVFAEKTILSSECKKLPNDDEVFKILSTGHFSSIAFIYFITDFTKINRLSASSLAIGKKYLLTLDALKTAGKIKDARFVVSSVMEKGVQEYGYFDLLKEICAKNNWEYEVKNNHAKVFLFSTKKGKYVLETSSNLSENPKIEQFSFEKSEELYDFYLKNLFGGD